MRIYNRVNAFLSNAATQDKLDFMIHVLGGWERWFQLELAYFIACDFRENYTVELETRDYGDSGKRADLHITNRNCDPANVIVVELKCEPTGTAPDAFLNSVQQDIDKLSDLDANISEFVSVALIREPTTLAKARTRFSAVQPFGNLVKSLTNHPLAGMIFFDAVRTS